MKTTLIAVSGMSPAIITETLWALADETPAVVPDDVVVLTTSKGEEDIKRMLLSEESAWDGRKVWETLRADILKKVGHPERSRYLQLALRVIDLPDEATGIRKPAEDLRTREHNDEAANFIVRVVDECATQDTHVIASIAGGRKTMGALLYAAMSLRGKETDRVTHVLVSDPFENCKGFFYPRQPAQNLTATPFGKPPVPVVAAQAKVEMADIPFVPLRNKFEELEEPRLTFAGLVDAYARARRKELQQPPRLALDAEKGILSVEGRRVSLGGRDLLIVALLFERSARGLKHFANKDEAAAEIAVFFKHWRHERPFHKALARISNLGVDDIPKALNVLRTKLRKIGLEGAIPHLAPEYGRIGFDVTR